jgi:O-antigen/teichoic acid export membrane protein
MATVPGTIARDAPLPERLVRNVLSNSASAALGAAAQLVAIVVTSQCLDTASYAAYLVAIALVGVAEMASDFGGRVWAAQQFALAAPPRSVLRDALVIKAVYSALMLLVVACLPWEGFTAATSVLCALIAITQSSSDPMLWYLRGAARLDAEAVIVLANRIAAAATACVLALGGWGLDAILAAWLACNLLRVVAAAAMPIMRPLFASRRGGANAPASPTLAALLAATIPLGGSLLLVSLFQRAGVLLMDSAGTARDVALFGTSYKFVSTASLLATSLALAHFPELVRRLAAGRTAEANRLLRSAILGITAIFAPLCVAGIACGQLLGEPILGAGLADAGMILAALMPGLYISSINIATKFTLTALDRNWFDASFAAAGLAAFCAMFYAPWPVSPCVRAAIAWTVGETLIFTLRREVVRRAAPGLRVQAGLVLGITAALAALASLRWQFQ